MAEQNIGTARIEVEVSTSGVTSGAERAKEAIRGIGTETAATSEVMTTSFNRTERALAKQIEVMGLSREERLRYNIAQKATAANQDELNARLDAAISRQRASAAATAEATGAEKAAAASKLQIGTYNGQVEESERSLAERRAQAAAGLTKTTAATVDWAREQELANERALRFVGVETQAAEAHRKGATATEAERAALAALVGQIDPAVAALARLDAAEEKLQGFRKQGLLSGADYTQYVGQINQQREALGKLNTTMGEGGMSTRAYSAAMRNLPAQFTDIAVSLQAGQAPLTVFLQQGGQLKDMFGGIGPAIQAMGSYVLGLVNPLTASAAALAALGIGAYQGAQEMDTLSAALISSGNSAGVSAAGLAEVAAKLDGLAGVTTGKAVDALAAVAATGAFTGDQLQTVATAALEWQTATGTAVDETVAKFVKLADDPVRAILELNKQMGFLTEQQLEVIRQLEEQGDRTGAATAAINAMADALHTRSAQMVQNLGYLERAWASVKNVVAETWDAIKSVGRDSTLQEKIEQAKSNIAGLEAASGVYSSITEAKRKELIQKFRADIAEMEKAQRGLTATNVDNAQSPAARRALEERVKFEEETTRQKQTQLTLEQKIQAMRASAAKNGVTDEALLAARETAMREAEARRLAKQKTSSSDNGLYSSQLTAIKAQTAAEAAEFSTQTKELQAQYQARTISAKDYYAGMRTLAEQQTATTVAGLEKQRAALEAQTGKRAASGAVAQQIAAVEAQLNQARAEGASRLRVLTTEEEAAAQKRAEGLRVYREALAAQTETLASQMSSMVDRERLGEREYEVQTKVNEVLAEQARQLRDLAAAQGEGRLSAEDVEVRATALRAEVLQRVQVIRDGYAAVDQERLSWENGLHQGMANIATESMNVAGQISSALNSAFNGAADAIATFATTGKLSFSSLATSILQDLTRIAAKVAISSALSSLFGGAFGGSSSSSGTVAGFGNNVDNFTAGFSDGGYTGAGDKYQVAGTVHKGEVVFSQDDVARNGGVDAVERMRLGSKMSSAGGTASATAGGGVVVNLIGLDKAPTETKQSVVDGQTQVDLIFQEIDARAAEGYANGTSRLAMAMGKGG